MSDQPTTDLVPCSKCGAPVLTNLAECMFCGQTDPGKLASNPVGRKFVDTKQRIRKRRQSAENSMRNRSLPGLPKSLENYRYLFQGTYAVTHTITAVYIALYLLSLLLDLRGAIWWDGFIGFAIPSAQARISLGATGLIPVMAGRVWSFLTAPYLHSSLIDVFISAVIFLQVGRLAERFLGSAPLFLIYVTSAFSGGVVATLFAMPLVTTPRIALFGIFAAIILYTRSQLDPMSQQIMRQMAIFAFLLLLFDLLGPLQMLLADVTGGLVGFGVTKLLLNNPGFRYDPLADRIARILGFVTAIFVLVSLVTSFIF